MTTVERSIVIKATADALDAVTLDGSRLPEWYAGISKADPDGPYPQPGGVVNVVYKAAGVNFKMSMTSLELVRGQFLKLKLDGMITGTTHWVYQPMGERIRLTCTFDYDMPGGGIGKALNKLVVEKMNTENLEKSLSNLKAVVEGK